jgi:hypothetical protein
MTYHADQAPASREALVADVAALQARITELQAENARLLKLLALTPQQARPPGPAQTGWYERNPGPVTDRSSPDQKVAFFAGLFAARTDVYATRWENTRLGKAGWSPAVRGGWRKGIRRHEQEQLPLTPDVLRAHLRGDIHLGLYPLLDGDTTWWLAADFDGHAAASSKPPAGSCGPTPARTPPRSTTTTTNTSASSPHHWPNASPATPAPGSPTHAEPAAEIDFVDAPGMAQRDLGSVPAGRPRW